MKPKKPQNQPELFRAQLSQIIDRNHVLVRLSTQINWERLESKIEIIYSEKGGQPPLPTRLLVGLHYLKYAFNESDESVVARWVETPYWQYFCGFKFLQHELPLHPTSMGKWRKCRAAIEPTIGHLKSDNRMERNFLRGAIGNKINTLMAAAAYNLRNYWRGFLLP